MHRAKQFWGVCPFLSNYLKSCENYGKVVFGIKRIIHVSMNVLFETLFLF
jgi:hypothetical protein